MLKVSDARALVIAGIPKVGIQALARRRDRPVRLIDHSVYLVTPTRCSTDWSCACPNDIRDVSLDKVDCYIFGEIDRTAVILRNSVRYTNIARYFDNMVFGGEATECEDQFWRGVGRLLRRAQWSRSLDRLLASTCEVRDLHRSYCNYSTEIGPS